MPRTCTICAHPDREAIDQRLVAGEALRDIAGRTQLSKTSLHRHQQDHVTATLARAQEAEEIARADGLLAQVKDLQDKALGILDKAERAGDLRTALAGVREARACLELLSKLSGELDGRAQINLSLDPSWIQIRTTILASLEPYPHARIAVVGALNGHAG